MAWSPRFEEVPVFSIRLSTKGKELAIQMLFPRGFRLCILKLGPVVTFHVFVL